MANSAPLIPAACRITVLCRAQVPQFLLEAGYGSAAFPERAGRIGVTQPRRVAAVAAATRIAQELGCPLGGLVGYQVRTCAGLRSAAFVHTMMWASAPGAEQARAVTRMHILCSC